MSKFIIMHCSLLIIKYKLENKFELIKFYLDIYIYVRLLIQDLVTDITKSFNTMKLVKVKLFIYFDNIKT